LWEEPNILGLDVLDWMLNYTVLKEPDNMNEYNLGEADSDGFGQLKVFMGTPPTGRDDPRWNTDDDEVDF